MSGRLTQCDSQRLILALEMSYLRIFFWEAASSRAHLPHLPDPCHAFLLKAPRKGSFMRLCPFLRCLCRIFYECLDSSAPPDPLSLRNPSGLWYLASQMSYRQSLRPDFLASPAGFFTVTVGQHMKKRKTSSAIPAASRRFSYPPKPRAMQ